MSPQMSPASQNPRAGVPTAAEAPLETQLVRSPFLAGAWWPLLVALVALGTLALVALVALAARRRHKETRYGAAFAPAVRFRVRSSYGRRSAQATLNRLGISPELKEKLRDVLVERHRVALGKTLGQGEFGSVVEGTLHQDSGVLRVAVKTMKLAICSRGELEDFLSEAVCMKEFDHPNVMKLIGVCLQPWGGGLGGAAPRPHRPAALHGPRRPAQLPALRPPRGPPHGAVPPHAAGFHGRHRGRG
ncbi:tyrosine-protein kinase receptor UFO-like [Anomalospiza imberbis]|uniref:tyrosine-protein kinase receptor UFO-like n=1 Tax=Anomalospiza imberbis TaxID=187417 RepID=UPI00358E8552